MRASKLALILSISLGVPVSAVAQPVPPDTGAVGGAVELPVFDLSASTEDLQLQLEAHRTRLASARDQLRATPTDTTLTVLIDQLAFRISLLEMLIPPVPAPAQDAAGRREQLVSVREDRAELAALTERAKSQGIGAVNQTELESRLAEMDALIRQIADIGSPAAPPASPATPPPVPSPTAPAPAPGAAPAPEQRTPPRLSLGDLMSTLNNLPARMEEVRALPQLDPGRVFVVPVSTLFPGNGNGPGQRAIDRGYFADLHAFLAADATLAGALAAGGYRPADSVGILADRAGNVVIFIDR